MNAIVKQQTGTVVPAQDPATLIALAIEKGANVDQLERLMDLQERWNAQRAKEAFFGALAQFQANAPRIEKRKDVAFNDVKYSYAPLPDMVEQLKQSLQAAGLSYRWEIADTESGLSVTFILTHTAGHAERTTMTAPPDSSGKKNAVQQRGSTITYLQRYTMIGGLGIAAADTDIDARLSRGEVITDQQAADLQALLDETGSDKAKFLAFLGVESLDAIPAAKYQQAVKAIERKKRK